MWCQQHVWIKHPSYLPPKNNNLASITGKSTSVATLGYSTMCQGTWGKSHPPVCQVLDIHTLVPAVDPASACELAPAPVSYGPGAPGECRVIPSPTDERAFFVEAQLSSREVSEHCWEKKNYKFRHIGFSKRNSLTFSPSLFFWGSTVRCQDRTSQPMVSLAGGGGENVSEWMISQLCRALPKWPFTFASSRV